MVLTSSFKLIILQVSFLRWSVKWMLLYGKVYLRRSPAVSEHHCFRVKGPPNKNRICIMTISDTYSNDFILLPKISLSRVFFISFNLSLDACLKSSQWFLVAGNLSVLERIRTFENLKCSACISNLKMDTRDVWIKRNASGLKCWSRRFFFYYWNT